LDTPTLVLMSHPPRFLTVTETVQRLAENGLDITDETVRRWAIDGKLRAIRLPSGHYRFAIEDVDAVLSAPASDRAAS
jgi:excisionase family DNA binding protein